MCTIPKYFSAANLACKLKNSDLVKPLIFSDEMYQATTPAIQHPQTLAITQFNRFVSRNYRFDNLQAAQEYYQQQQLNSPQHRPKLQHIFTNWINSKTFYDFYSNLSKRDLAIVKQYRDKKCHYWPLVRPNEVEFRGNEYRVAILRRLLMPVHTFNTACRACRRSDNVDPFGDHAIICTTGSSNKNRHNNIQHTLYLMGRRAGHTMDKEISCGHDSSKVPADIFIHNYENGRHLAIDVSITCCTNQSTLNQSYETQGITAVKALKKKFNKYRNETFYNKVDFAPFIIEDFGLLHPTAKEIFDNLCQKIANCTNTPVDRIKFYYGKIINAQLIRQNSDTILLKCNVNKTIPSNQCNYNHNYHL